MFIVLEELEGGCVLSLISPLPAIKCTSWKVLTVGI
jgi:hypothetical protein